MIYDDKAMLGMYKKKTALSDWAGRNTTTIMDFCIMFLNENL